MSSENTVGKGEIPRKATVARYEVFFFKKDVSVY